MASLMRALKVAIISRPRALAARAFSAVVYDQQGSRNSFARVEVKENDVCARMIAAPINPSDINRIEEVPAVGGYEGVGEVHSVGSAVKDLSPGDLVIPSPPSFGTLHTYIVADKSVWHKMYKVEALEEKLEEVKNFKNTDINQRFSLMEGTMKQLLELHSRSAPVAETGLAIKDADVDSKLQNLKMPIFDGEDVHGWVYRAEKYFDTNGVTEGEKMVEVTGCLEFRALPWYQQQENRQAFRSWEEFETCLFIYTQGGELCDKQGYGFHDGLSDAELEENYMRAMLLQMKPQNSNEMIGLAVMIKDVIRANQCKTGTSSVSNSDEEQSGSNLKHFILGDPAEDVMKAAWRRRVLEDRLYGCGVFQD